MCERAETAGVDGIHETDNMIRVFKTMCYAFAHGEMFYEDDTKENVVIPVLCCLKDDLRKLIFRDCPDGSAHTGRRWDLQLSKKPLSTNGGWSDAFECKRISKGLRKRTHPPQDVKKWLINKTINGRGDPFLQVFLCKKSGRFIEADRIWLTNGIKWYAFYDSFFELWRNPHQEDSRSEKHYRVVDFEESLKAEDFNRWMMELGQLLSMFKPHNMSTMSVNGKSTTGDTNLRESDLAKGRHEQLSSRQNDGG